MASIGPAVTGRPVVCLDIGGPASQVTPETGFAAPATTPAEAVEAMAAFLARIAGNRALLATMSANARARVREKFTMRIMGSAIDSFYQQAAASQASPVVEAPQAGQPPQPAAGPPDQPPAPKV